MTATYNVQAKYTVTIPAGAPIGEDADHPQETSITASGVVLEEGQKITVTLSQAANTAKGESAFTAKNGTSAVTYAIKKGGDLVKVGDPVAEFTANGEQALSFYKTGGTPTVAGEHTETLTFGISVEDSFESVLAPVLENGATMVIAYRWNDYNTTTFTFTNNNGTYSCNVGGDETQDFSGSLTLNATTLALSITNSVMSSRINLAISFDTTNDTYSFVTKGSWYNSHTVSVNGTNITDKLTAKN